MFNRQPKIRRIGFIRNARLKGIALWKQMTVRDLQTDRAYVDFTQRGYLKAESDKRTGEVVYTFNNNEKIGDFLNEISAA
jgi:hypothetical protein